MGSEMCIRDRDFDGVLDIDDLSPDLLDKLPATQATQTSEPLPTSELLSTGDAPAHLIGKSLKEIEKWAIENSLKLTGGNREETANILGISERNLYRKLNEYDLRQ